VESLERGMTRGGATRGARRETTHALPHRLQRGGQDKRCRTQGQECIAGRGEPRTDSPILQGASDESCLLCAHGAMVEAKR